MPATARKNPYPILPDRVSYDGKERTIGRAGYALLAHVINSGGTAVLMDLSESVYGKSVTRNRVEVQCHRINAKLEELGCPLRLGIDQGRVTLG